MDIFSTSFQSAQYTDVGTHEAFTWASTFVACAEQHRQKRSCGGLWRIARHNGEKLLLKMRWILGERTDAVDAESADLRS